MTAATLTPAGRRALERAAKRERGNICPSGLPGNADTMLLKGLDARGFITWDGGVPFKGAPRINDAGRAALAEQEHAS